MAMWGRIAALTIAAVALTACSTAEDYLQSVNPFRRADVARVIEGLNSPGPVAGEGGRLWHVPARGSATASPPIIVQSKVVVYDGRRVTAYALGSGQEVWSASTHADRGEREVAGGGVVADDGRVYVATGLRRLLALDTTTGRQVWAQTLPEPALGPPAVSGGRIVFVAAGGAAYSFSTSDGSEVWRYSGSGGSGARIAQANPATASGLVIVPFASGEVVAFDAARGSARWTTTIARDGAGLSLADVIARPVVASGSVFLGSSAGRLVAVRERTGQIIWERPIAITQAVAPSGDMVVSLSRSGEMSALDRSTGAVRWSARLPGTGESSASWYGPTLVGSMLWAASDRGQMVAIDVASGRLGAQRDIGAQAAGPPLAAGGRLIVPTARGGLVALE
jgi:outer membrane protein assembly factor BamB